MQLTGIIHSLAGSRLSFRRQNMLLLASHGMVLFAHNTALISVNSWLVETIWPIEVCSQFLYISCHDLYQRYLHSESSPGYMLKRPIAFTNNWFRYKVNNTLAYGWLMRFISRPLLKVSFSKLMVERLTQMPVLVGRRETLTPVNRGLYEECSTLLHCVGPDLLK